MLEKVKTMGTRLALAAAILAPIGLGIYATSGSTLLDDNKVANDWKTSCSVNVDLRQSGRISLDRSRYGKDLLNQTTFEMPVACDQLESMSADHQIVDEFRWGSFITEFGSSSSWDMSVANKNTVPDNADTSSCTLNLTLRERHSGFLTHTFAKDNWNAQSFDWQVPCDVHDIVDVGHNFVSDPWRKGSIEKRLITKGSDWAAGTWNVEVTGKQGPSL